MDFDVHLAPPGPLLPPPPLQAPSPLSFHSSPGPSTDLGKRFAGYCNAPPPPPSPTPDKPVSALQWASYDQRLPRSSGTPGLCCTLVCTRSNCPRPAPSCGARQDPDASWGLFDGQILRFFVSLCDCNVRFQAILTRSVNMSRTGTGVFLAPSRSARTGTQSKKAKPPLTS